MIWPTLSGFSQGSSPYGVDVSLENGTGIMGVRYTPIYLLWVSLAGFAALILHSPVNLTFQIRFHWMSRNYIEPLFPLHPRNKVPDGFLDERLVQATSPSLLRIRRKDTALRNPTSQKCRSVLGISSM